MRIVVLAVSFLAAAAAQSVTVRNTDFEGRPALRLSSGAMELTVLVQGGSMAAVVLSSDPGKLNPMWEPARMQRELGQTPRASGGTGHFVCVDGFGPVSAEERAAGLEGHGEAYRQQCEVLFSGVRGGAAEVSLRATLPVVQEVFTRTFTLRAGEQVVTVVSELESLLGFDRPVNWAEHATVGSPFLEPGVTVMDLSGSRAQTRPYGESARGTLRRRLASGADFTWPLAPALDGTTADLRFAPTQLDTLDHAAVLIDPARKPEAAAVAPTSMEYPGTNQSAENLLSETERQAKVADDARRREEPLPLAGNMGHYAQGMVAVFANERPRVHRGPI